MLWSELKLEAAKALGVPVEEVEEPERAEQGDFAWPAFGRAKAEKKNPADIAKELAGRLKVKGVSQVRSSGPYVQFFVDWAALGKELLQAVDAKYGTAKATKRTAVVEYCSPNPAHPFHMGTVRNTLLGESLCRTLASQGWSVKRECYINDIGKQGATLLTGYQMLASGKKPEGKPDVWLGKIYFEINNQAEEGSDIEQRVFENLHSYEQGDKELRKLGKLVYGWCLQGFEEDWKRMGVKFDKLVWESELVDESKHLIKLLDVKGLLFEADGAQVLALEKHGLPNTIILRKDGTGLYLTRDLPHALWKEREWKPDLNVYVVGEEQTLHFKQLFKTLELLGYTKLAKVSRHLSYSLVLLEGQKMSARRGIQVLWDELLAEGIKRARAEIDQRWPELKEKEKAERAEQIAIGAISYYMLKYSPEKPVNFTWAEAMRFEGDTGPYLQYTHARARSIIGKVKAKKAAKSDASLLTDAKEIAVMRMLAKYPIVMAKTAEQLRPHLLAEYLHVLADTFNTFYQSVRVLQAETEELKAARLKLVEAAATVLKSGLTLLAVPVPEKL